MKYRDSLELAMTLLSGDRRTVFIGQGCRDPGTFMSTTLKGVPDDQKIEYPVAEEMQLGASIGMALNGLIPISIFPRWNFLLLATNQLVSHLDKMQPHVIVRVGVGSSQPLDPGPQHTGDMTEAFRLLMPNTPIIRLGDMTDIIPEYQKALERQGPTVLVEVADLYES